MDLGQKSMCKAPVSSLLKGLIYSGLERVRGSWPEVGPQLTAQSRDHRFGQVGVLALISVENGEFRVDTFGKWGHP